MTMAESRGSLLINLIVGMMIVAIIGTAMIYMTTTSTYAELFANNQARAYYLAEAGGRYAIKLLNENKAAYLLNEDNRVYPGGNEETEEPPTSYTLSNGEKFILTSYDFKENGVSDTTRVVIKCIGVVHAGTWMESRRQITYGGKEGIDRANPTPSTETADFIEYITDSNVFVYGSTMEFAGDNVTGDGATIVIKGKEGQAYALTTNQVNGGAHLAATTIYIGGNVKLDGGSASLGSSTAPGNIYINGSLELWNGKRDIYGDVYVNGNFRLKDAKIYGNIYVNGTVELGWTPTLSSNTNIYYVGDGNPATPDIIHPSYYNQSILDKCHKIPYQTVTSFPSFSMPDYTIPEPRESQWFADNGYVSSGNLVTNMKIYTDGNYTSNKGPTAQNVIIVSKGNITIKGWSNVTGILYAPSGKVTFEGGNFTGVVIAKEGFFETGGGTNVTFDQSYLDYLGADGPFRPDTTVSQY
ncbi:MAG: hypothetical protein STSR0003_29700 [Smithella sp.]